VEPSNGSNIFAADSTGFLCCDLFSAEFMWPWHIPKELVSIPQKNEAGATFPLVVSPLLSGHF
jgi:hypothetical protein